MMFQTLYLFLIRNKQLCLPEIGVISLQLQPAKTKFIDRSVLPPGYSFRFSIMDQASTNKLTNWIAHELNISETEAIARFNDFVYEIKKQLQEGKEVVWNGVGKFSKGLMNEIEFESEKKALAFYQPVLAEKVIRDHARHIVMVGEREKTASDISEIMAETEGTAVSRTNWWVWPVALLVFSLIFLGWYFSEHGIKPSSSANTERSIPKDAPSGFYFSK